jgi:hypothetical protein
MSEWEQTAEKTYRAIGRFMFEFSQVEYTIRHYLANEIGLKDEHFSAIVESYDVGLLITVARQVFTKRDQPAVSAPFIPGPLPDHLKEQPQGQQPQRRQNDRAKRIDMLLNRFYEHNVHRNRVAHGLWVPFKDGGTVHHVSRNKLTPGSFADQAAALEKHADELCQLRDDLENAFMHFELGSRKA